MHSLVSPKLTFPIGRRPNPLQQLPNPIFVFWLLHIMIYTLYCFTAYFNFFLVVGFYMNLKFPGEPCNLEMLFQIFKMHSFALPGVCEVVLTFWL